MKQDFINIKDLKQHIVNRKVSTKKQKVSIRWIHEKPFTFNYHYSLNELECWKEVDLKPKQKGRPVIMGWLTIPPLSNKPRGIKKAKMLALLPYIPPAFSRRVIMRLRVTVRIKKRLTPIVELLTQMMIEQDGSSVM